MSSSNTSAPPRRTSRRRSARSASSFLACNLTSLRSDLSTHRSSIADCRAVRHVSKVMSPLHTRKRHMKRLNFLNRYSPVLLAGLRIVTALLVLSAGLVKLVGFPAGAQPGQMPIMSLLGGAAILEAVGGLLLLLGMFTRPVAFVLSGAIAVAYWLVHASKTFFPIPNQGPPAIVICFSCFYLLAP